MTKTAAQQILIQGIAHEIRIDNKAGILIPVAFNGLGIEWTADHEYNSLCDCQDCANMWNMLCGNDYTPDTRRNRK